MEGWDAPVTEGDSDASRLVLTLSKGEGCGFQFQTVEAKDSKQTALWEHMTDEKGRFLYKFDHDWLQKFVLAGVEYLLVSCSNVEKALEGRKWLSFV